MAIFDWLRRGHGDLGKADKQALGEAVERIAKLNPQLRAARRFEARLQPAVARSLDYVRAIVAAVPTPREASAAAWSADPYIHAFFATPDDVGRVINRAMGLRTFFDQNPDLAEVYAVLGMSMDERKRVGMAVHGDTVRRDTVQTAVSFSDHQLRICGRTDAELRQEIVWRLLDQLGLEGLARIAADKSRRDLLERDRTLLKARLQLLESQGAGMRGVLGSENAEPAEKLARLQVQIDDNERDLQQLGLRTEALEHDLEHLCAVLGAPEQHIYVEDKQLCLNKMNIVIPENGEAGEGGDEVGESLNFQVARIPTTPPQMRAFSLVRCSRSQMTAARDMLNEAMRQLNLMT